MNANFENYARKQLRGHEVEVDADALWANIQPQVSPQGGNRKIIGFFLLGLLLGLTIFGVFYISNDTQIVGTNQSENSLNINNDINSTMAISTEKTIDEQVVKQSEALENNTVETNTVTTSTANTTLNANKKATKEAKKVQLSNRNKISVTASDVKTQTTANNVSAAADNVPSEGISINTISDNNNNNEIVADKAPVFSPMKQDAKTVVAAVENRFLAVNSIPTLLPDALHSEKEMPVGFLDAYKRVPAKFDAVQKKRRRRGSMLGDLKVGLGLYTGLTSSAADLEANTTDADEYLILRTNSEKQLESLHFGFNAIVEAENNLYLRTGAEYTRIASLFSRASEQTILDSIPGIIEIQVNEVTGDTVEIEGMVLRTTVTSFTKKSYNYFHQVDVPIILGYNFGDDDWRIGIEAGVYANILMKRKGEISLADGDFYDIDEDQNDWYKNNIGISPFIGINAAYNVSENIQVHFSPNFRFKSVYSTDASFIKERHASLGVHAGVRYFFD